MTIRIRTAILAVILAVISILTIIIGLGGTERVNKTSSLPRIMPKIVLDAGHGGVDGGTVSKSGIVEKHINLNIVLKLREMLSAAGFDVIMTRSTDISIHDPSLTTVRQIKTSDLRNRMKLMEENSDGLFISIHQNYFTSAKYFGTQVFYSPNNTESSILAENIQNSIKKILQPENTRQTKKSTKSIYLLYEAKSPAVMVECGFLSNTAEAERLQNDEYQNQMAFSIMCGVLEYYNLGTK